MCCCASKRWFRHTCDLINCSLILYWIRYKESVWKYLLQLQIVICANSGLFWLGCLLLIVFCVEQWASFLLVRNCDCDLCEVTLCGWQGIQIQELNNLNMCNGPVLIWWMKYMSRYRICMGITHCATLLQNIETKEPIRMEWCKLLKKARTANPSATRMLAVA